MGHGEGGNLQRAQVYSFAITGELYQIVQYLWASDSSMGAATHDDRNAVTRGEAGGAANMVTVLMGDKNGGKLRRLNPRLL